MNLVAPPAAKRLIGWLLRNKASVADYFKAVNQLSKLTLVVSYRGRTKKVVVVFNGTNAQLNVNLDSLLQ